MLAQSAVRTCCGGLPCSQPLQRVVGDTGHKDPISIHDAIVAGGGGSSTAYQLQSKVCALCCLNRTPHGGHDVAHRWHALPLRLLLDIELHTRTRQLAMELEAEKGAAWTENGGLFIACDKERLAEYERLAQTGDKADDRTSVAHRSQARPSAPQRLEIYGAVRRRTAR